MQRRSVQVPAQNFVRTFCFHYFGPAPNYDSAESLLLPYGAPPADSRGAHAQILAAVARSPLQYSVTCPRISWVLKFGGP
jgi:hypothetical protein